MRAAAGSEAGGGAFKDSLCGRWRPQNFARSSLGESEDEAEVRASGKEWPQPRERRAGQHRGLPSRPGTRGRARDRGESQVSVAAEE